MLDAATETSLAGDRLGAIVAHAKANNPEAALPIALALAGQCFKALFSITASLESLAASQHRIANPFESAEARAASGLPPLTEAEREARLQPHMR